MEITDKVESILLEKGVVLWCRGRIQESESCIASAAQIQDWQHVAFPTVDDDPHTDTLNKTLMLKTSIRYGVISYKQSDVIERKKSWNPPSELVSDLLHKWKDVPIAGLEIFSDKKSGVLRAVVRDSSISRMMLATSKLFST